MDLVNRLHTYIQSTGLTISQFADTAGITRPTLSQILNGRNKKISNEILGKLHSAFPDLDIMWLLFGEKSDSNGVDVNNANRFSRPYETNLTDEMTDDNRLDEEQYSESGDDEYSGIGKDSVTNGVTNGYNDRYGKEAQKQKTISDEDIVTFANDFFPTQGTVNTPGTDSHRNEPKVASRSYNTVPHPVRQTESVEDNNRVMSQERPKPRKIVSITVFYDDNTYETLSLHDKTQS